MDAASDADDIIFGELFEDDDDVTETTFTPLVDKVEMVGLLLTIVLLEMILICCPPSPDAEIGPPKKANEALISSLFRL